MATSTETTTSDALAADTASLTLAPYLHFDGKCEEALAFYKSVFGGDIAGMMRWGDAPAEFGMPPEYKEKIMHAAFKAQTLEFMAADMAPSTPAATGSHVSLSIGTSNVEAGERVFNKLADGGQVVMPMADTFWGARFGMLTDKFGIAWMINAQKS